jgi:beta-mannosidase
MTSLQLLDWSVGSSASREATPSTFFAAQVPGAVQLDHARAHDWPSYWYSENFRAYDGLEDLFWTYRATLPSLDFSNGQRQFFVCGGVDYQFEIRVGSQLRHAQEGMIRPVEIELTASDAGQQIEILVFPAPKIAGVPRNRREAAASTKPAVSYGWDWHPRLIPLGIWDETGLQSRHKTYLKHAEVSYDLADDFSRAALRLETELDGAAEGFSLRWSLTAPNGQEVFQTGEAQQQIDNPVLWWTHDQGEPALYVSRVELLNEQGDVVDARVARVGLRRVRLVMHEGAWDRGGGPPSTRNDPPMTLELNGRAIFAKGSNFVNSHIFPGAVEDATLRALVEAGKEAHFNLFRMWGGAPVQKKAFWEACDELGILVWQEFPLACNAYPDDEKYLSVLDAESRALIKRLRPHASLAMWCGGNELFNSWTRMDDQSHALRLLNRNCFDLDKHRPFLPTSPVSGVLHGHYSFYDSQVQQVEAWAMFQNSDATAYTEFGVPGPSPVEVLKTFLPPDELFPPHEDSSWRSHHAFGVWAPNSWLCLDVIEKYLGPSDTLEELVAKGELLQCEGYKGLYEEARRQKPRSSMALNWCYNDCWPAAANNSLLAFPSLKKPAFYAVQSACRPTMASARIPKFQWQGGELFTAQLWLLNDAPADLAGGEMEAILVAGDQEISLLRWQFATVAANCHQSGPQLHFELPDWDVTGFELHLRVNGQAGWNSVYTLGYCPKPPEVWWDAGEITF